MKELLEQIRIKAVAEIEASDNTEELRIKYLGKKGELTAVLRGMGKVAPAERPIIGQLANEVRATIEEALTKKAEEQKKKEMERRLMTEKLDVTLPGKIQTVGQTQYTGKCQWLRSGYRTKDKGAVHFLIGSRDKSQRRQ